MSAAAVLVSGSISLSVPPLRDPPSRTRAAPACHGPPSSRRTRPAGRRAGPGRTEQGGGQGGGGLQGQSPGWGRGLCRVWAGQGTGKGWGSGRTGPGAVRAGAEQGQGQGRGRSSGGPASTESQRRVWAGLRPQQEQVMESEQDRAGSGPCCGSGPHCDGLALPSAREPGAAGLLGGEGTGSFGPGSGDPVAWCVFGKLPFS